MRRLRWVVAAVLLLMPTACAADRERAPSTPSQTSWSVGHDGLEKQRPSSSPNFGSKLSAGDFDGDGDDDLAVGDISQQVAYVLPGDPDGLTTRGHLVLSQETLGVPGGRGSSMTGAVLLSRVRTDTELAKISPWPLPGRGRRMGTVTIFYGSSAGPVLVAAAVTGCDPCRRPKRVDSTGRRIVPFGSRDGLTAKWQPGRRAC
jgi:hypothetical protein